MNITQKAKEQRVNNLCTQLRKIKTDLLNVENTNYKSHSMYHTWINQQKQFITPNKITYKKNNIVYDLMCSPMEYFPCMIKMMKQVEEEEQAICNVFPMRNQIIPKHIRLDTTTLVHLLMTKKQGNKSDYLTEANALDLSVLQERFRPNKTQSNTIHKNNINQVLTDDSLTKKISEAIKQCISKGKGGSFSFKITKLFWV